MFPRRYFGVVLLTVTTLMLAVVASVAAVTPSREEVELPNTLANYKELKQGCGA